MINDSAFYSLTEASLAFRTNSQPMPSFEAYPPVSQPSQETCLELQPTRLQRVAEKLGGIVCRLENSGVMTLLIGGIAAWPGPVALASRFVVHTTQTAGTYCRVRESGYEGTDALVKTAQWTIIGR